MAQSWRNVNNPAISLLLRIAPWGLMVYIWFTILLNWYNLYGLYMVYIWFLYGLYMVYIWFIYGLYMVYIWFIYGLYMVYIWFIYGLYIYIYMVYIWFIYGFHNLPAKWYNLRLFLPFGTEKDVGKLWKSSDKSVSTIFSHGQKWKMLGVFWTNPLIWWIHIKESTKYGYIYLYIHIKSYIGWTKFNHVKPPFFRYLSIQSPHFPHFDGEIPTPWDG